MDAKEQEFLKRLRATFQIEAEEHFRALSAGLIELEKMTEPTQRAALVEGIFREAHSLKGAARSVNLKDVESLCQSLESALAALKRQEIPLSPALFDLFHQTLDTLMRLVSATETEPSLADRAQLRELSHQLAEAAQGGTPPAVEDRQAQPAPPKKNPLAQRPAGETQLTSAETVRIPTAKLDPLLLQAEAMIQAKLAGSQRAVELRELHQSLVSWRTDWAKWNAQHPEQPEWAATRLEALTGKAAALSHAFEQDLRALQHMVDDHLDAMKQVLMLPASTLVEVLPQLVRNLARDKGKEVDLVIRGDEIVIDKRILEELKAPLIHLVRNCIDHGIEKPEARLRQQKPRRGTITLTFSTHDSRNAEILISDDGAGIDVDRVRAVAIKAGAMEAQATGSSSPQEILQLIYQSGLSTSEIITDTSGRGLGLAIVREKAEKLNGLVSVDSQPGIGTTFRLRLPLRLATFQGLLVSAREQVFVLPIAHIERAVRVAREEIQTVENRETIQLDGRILSLASLGDLLELPLRNRESGREADPTGHHRPAAVALEHINVLILASADQRIAIQVDQIIGEEEVLVKGLGKQLSRVRNISGATVLGDGKVAPVLNVADLMKAGSRPGAGGRGLGAVQTVQARTGRILVAEDSITSRTLLKNILETGGYRVTTAVDGADAFAQLRSGEFDLLVSDVDMPRLSGFELTTKIRGDNKLAELPVVLVTALESLPDRERGIEVGANAYIIKSSFDQSNLLQVIQQLL